MEVKIEPNDPSAIRWHRHVVSLLLISTLSLSYPSQAVESSSTAPPGADSCAPGVAGKLRAASFNLLNKNAPHAYFFSSWRARGPAIAKWILKERIDVLGTQEGTPAMIESLQARLQNYQAVGRPRSDSRLFGETSSILFNKLRFELLQSGDFWLSETPEIPGSKGWDAANVRICTWVELRDRTTGASWFVFNAHYDHIGSKARRESSRLVLRKIREIAGSQQHLLLGDLNASIEDEALRILKAQLKETRESSVTPPKGPENTYILGRRLDYILTSPEVITCSMEVKQPMTRRKRRLSDHRPVVVDVRSHIEHP